MCGCLDGTAIRFELKASRKDPFNAVQMVSLIKWFKAIKIKAIVIMLISMMVPTFIIFTSFLYKQGCTTPKDYSEYTTCLSNILYSMLLRFIFLCRRGSDPLLLHGWAALLDTFRY